MPRYRFSSDQIMTDVYEPSEGQSNELALFLYGFPATIGENAATNLFNTFGYTVMQPHYPGTYDSGGRFSPASAIQMVPTLAHAISTGTVQDVKRQRPRAMSPRISVCIGYSFGSIVALNALNALPDVELLVLFSPAMTYGPATIPSGFTDEGPEFLDYVKRSRPYTYRLDDADTWSGLYRGALNTPVAAPPSPSSVRQVIGIVGAYDDMFDLPTLNRNFSAVVEPFLGAIPQCTVITVDNGTHSIGTLVTDSVARVISGALHTH